MKIAITQSNYIPWKGYFDSIKHVDIFVEYDCMQYTKRDWRNRNIIKTAQGLKWLTIPVEVKGKYFQRIRDTKIADKSWTTSHWDIIKQAYKTAAHFKLESEWLEGLYKNCNFDYLTDVNLYFIKAINEHLDIHTIIKSSLIYELAEDRTQRLVEICKSLKGTDYYSGAAAKSYMELEKFTKEKINVHWWDYSDYPEYEQLHGNFEHGVSILDLILNVGHNNVMKYLK
ncbi:MAG: WbqC family protein [Chitinophagales bacterium]|nr:WbqC family protein [Chitinophagales bacterium]